MLELHCQVLHGLDQSRVLPVCTVVPVGESYERLQLLSVIGDQSLKAWMGALAAGVPKSPQLTRLSSMSETRLLSLNAAVRVLLHAFLAFLLRA
ncbi:hypothetical protein J7E87_09850 [Streptomyces sp. ISL-1]|nr:hypothetical protein [Streptomyces sp. ISL-1]